MNSPIFYDNQCGYRGTTRAALTYASSLKSLGLIEDFIFCYLTDSPYNSNDYIESLKNQNIRLASFSSIDNFITYANNTNPLFVYYNTSQSFSPNNLIFYGLTCNLFAHQVGMNPPPSKHLLATGLRSWAYTSLWQSHYYSAGEAPFLNYSVHKPHASLDCLRSSLGIKPSDCVYGRFGGLDTWNLQFANQAILNSLQHRDDIWFIFASTPVFINHPRVVFLDPLIDDLSRQKFINTCDAMLHCRWEGETFGLACAEFLASGKPIITWSQSRERNHILLADRAILLYHDLSSLTSLLSDLSKLTLAELSNNIPTSILTDLSVEKTSLKLYKLALSLR